MKKIAEEARMKTRSQPLVNGNLLWAEKLNNPFDQTFDFRPYLLVYVRRETGLK